MKMKCFLSRALDKDITSGSLTGFEPMTSQIAGGRSNQTELYTETLGELGSYVLGNFKGILN